VQRPIPVLPILSLLVLVGTLALAGGIACVRQNRLVNVGEEILYDDFGFTVLGVEKLKSVGPPGRNVHAYGTFWVVDLEVRNHARRVSYHVDSHVPLLVDGSGREIPVSGRGQAAFDAGHGAAATDDGTKLSSLGPGDHLVTPLVFDVPDDAGDVRLKLVFGGAVGEVLDYVFLGNRRFRLR
jgi:hypothetical protein